ncbi:MAG: hypothetical protein ABGU97_11295 [Xylella fastidiosa subsp. multiplex]
MRDSITVLKHPVNTLAKTWRADGSVKAYDNAKFFQVEQRALNYERFYHGSKTPRKYPRQNMAR